MKKGEICKGIVERVDFPAKGRVRLEDGTFITVKNVLPGQEVTARINKIRKGKAEGALIEVSKKGPREIDPPCSLFGVCGGCSYLALPYEEQLKLKEGQIRRLLDPVMEMQETDWIWDGIFGSPKDLEYRNKMEFTFGDEYKDGPLALGMHKRGSFYDIVTVRNCLIVDSDYRAILSSVLDFCTAKGLSFYHRLSHEGYLRHLLVRKASSTGQILVALVTSSQSPSGEDALLNEFKDMLLALESDSTRFSGSFAGILHIVNDSVADVIKSDETQILYGAPEFTEELLGLQFKVSTFSFFQTNSYGAGVLYGKVRDYALSCLEGRKVETIYDLYCGTGTITQLMAPVAECVTGVEIVEEAVEAAKMNAAGNGLDNCKFIAGDVLKVLDSLTEPPQLMVLDPPRDGIHPKALPKLLNYGSPFIIYIACKPTSLVRDLPFFMEAGYQVERACCVDQFPQTANTEVIVLMTRK